jgi:hypothetical protein
MKIFDETWDAIMHCPLPLLQQAMQALDAANDPCVAAVILENGWKSKFGRAGYYVEPRILPGEEDSVEDRRACA